MTYLVERLVELDLDRVVSALNELGAVEQLVQIAAEIERGH